MNTAPLVALLTSLLASPALAETPQEHAATVLQAVQGGKLGGDEALEALMEQQSVLTGLLQDSPDDWKLYELRAQLQATYGQYAGAARDYAAAAAAYRRAPPRFPDPSVAFVFSRRAEVQFERLGQLDPAIDTLLEGQTLLKDLVAQIEEVRGGRSGAAWDQLELTIRQAQESVNRALLKAFLEQTGRRDEAIEAFAHALAVLPDDYEVRLRYGELLVREERHEEALDAYRTAAVLKPDASQPWCRIAVVSRPVLAKAVQAEDKASTRRVYSDLTSAAERCLSTNPQDLDTLQEWMLAARLVGNARDERDALQKLDALR